MYLGGPIKIPEATILYNESKHNILALVGKADKGVVCWCGDALNLLETVKKGEGMVHYIIRWVECFSHFLVQLGCVILSFAMDSLRSFVPFPNQKKKKNKL
jgi:hypothetical protein